MKGLISAIIHMNERDIMHRDLKPENILFKVINDFSTVYIADFGLAT
jgi:serine/threonine protein kinase